MNLLQQRLLAVAAAALFANAAHAGTVASRADLQTAIGGVGTVETFQSLGSSTFGFGCTGNALSASASCGVPTSGLQSGVAFTSSAFQLDGPGYYGSPSTELLSNSGVLGINFAGSVNAVGLDLRAFSGYGANATITVFGADDATVLATISNFNLGASGAPVFFGYESTAGIGSLSLSQGSYSWSPLVDNVEWGNTTSAVPEPTSIALIGLSLGLFAMTRRKRA